MSQAESNTTHLSTEALDALTGGAFSAATSSERAAKVRAWLASEPTHEQMQEVFRALSARDKGAARALKEQLDEHKRERAQDARVAEWAERAQALLALSRLNIADALAWLRDAARAGAPLSREPLAGLKTELAERVKLIEDLHHRAQVQRESAVLLVQRVELLSTKPLAEAQQAWPTATADVAAWQKETQALQGHTSWPDVDPKFPPQLEAAQTQLGAVHEAFVSVLAQAEAASADTSVALPSVPVWADELRAARAAQAQAQEVAARPARTKVDPAQRAQAMQAVREALEALERELSEGHGKASAAAAGALRQVLKEHGRVVSERIEHQAQAALAAAGEMVDWQRWRADQIRAELVAKAEALFEPVPSADKATPKPSRARGAGAPTPNEGMTTHGAEAADVSAESSAESSTALASDSAPQATLSDIPAPTSDAPMLESEGARENAQDTAVEDVVEGADIGADTGAQTGADASADKSAAASPATELADTGSALTAPDPSSATEKKSAPTEAARTNKTALALRPRFGGRKMQQELRALREQWRATDLGGAPNHALWKRFDAACNRAHQVVEAWLTKIRAEEAQHRSERLALMDELKAWAADNTTARDNDWRGFARVLHQFGERWRNAGHLSEKAFGELQPRWKEAMNSAAAPINERQRQSSELRQQLIEQAQTLAAGPLRVAELRALQQRWQVEAQTVPLERRIEQKMWQAFREPIDQAFTRKDQERSQAQASQSAHDRAVLEASKALQQANAGGDAQKIRQALAALDALLHGRVEAAASVGASTNAAQANPAAPASQPVQAEPTAAAPQAESSGAEPRDAPSAETSAETGAGASTEIRADADAAAAAATADSTDADSSPAPAAVAATTPTPPAPIKRVLAVRGDDRPGMKKAEPPQQQRPGRPGFARPGEANRGNTRADKPGWGERGAGAPRRDGRDGRDSRDGRDGRMGPGAGAGMGAGFGAAAQERGPRLGDAAFRAQRQALEDAQQALKRLAVQAHGEALTQVLAAWQQRDASAMPSVQELGRRVSASVRGAWAQALGGSTSGDGAQALLRLEIAAEIPTPAEHLAARRTLQLLLLTKKREPGPSETWGQDVGAVLASPHDAGQARRLQAALKVLLR